MKKNRLLKRPAINYSGRFYRTVCIVRVIYIVFLFALCGCFHDNAKSTLYDTGVSKELAQLRKASISRLNYKLLFNIPIEQDSIIKSSISINFDLDKNHYDNNLIIDFKPDVAIPVGDNNKTEFKLHETIVVNGKNIRTNYLNEHIVIPKSSIINGSNTIQIEFIAGNGSLNRRKDLMYSLLVPDRARTLFPCFDQPDLKANYQLTLEIPESWEAVSNSHVGDISYMEKNGAKRKIMQFAKTEPLSTYLFSFVTGIFSKSVHFPKNDSVSVDSLIIYHRETDKNKIEQLDRIAEEVFSSLQWLENYTDIPYPFSKYDLIILPGFQYGGMEHTGATLYNSNRMFLPENSTIQQQISRTELIAHETAHMWFGDFVTMHWFSDVWVKEVFANFFASLIVRPLHPDMDFTLNDNKFYTSSYKEERTEGANAIEQELPNLKYAGLIYGNIIYQKSPIVMNMLYKRIGEENFRKAIKEYLNTYKYSNASCDDLMQIFAKNSPKEVDLAEWSKYWLYGKGMPEVSVKNPNGNITDAKIIYAGDNFQNLKTDTLKLGGSIPIMKTIDRVKFGEYFIWPNSDGQYYGYIELDKNSSEYIMKNLYNKNLPFFSPIMRKSALVTLYENYLHDNIASASFVENLSNYLKIEDDPQIFPTVLNYMTSIAFRNHNDKIAQKIDNEDSTIGEFVENSLRDYSINAANKTFATQAFRSFASMCRTEKSIDALYDIWKNRNGINGLLLNDNDYIGLAYDICIKTASHNYDTKEKENEADNMIADIISTQRKRISNPDKLSEFDHISKAVVRDTAVLDSLFNSLLVPKGRKPEPWAIKILSLLNHPLREKHSRKYILQGLESLEEIQRTNDIFFPANWIDALLSGHYSQEASKIVDDFLKSNAEYPILLKNKILQTRYYLP